jgi:hypothetical protein
MEPLTTTMDPRPSPVGYAPFRDERARFETHGSSLVRYVARRTAKTRLLLPLSDLLAPVADGSVRGEATDPDARPDPGPGAAEALALVGRYVLAAATSYGRGYRQPSFDAVGTVIAERDPETGAAIEARLDGRGPGSRLRLSVEAHLPGIGRFAGAEEITGTTVGLHGLGMPAPSRFAFETESPLSQWSAIATGVVTTELGPSLGGFVVRGHADLELADSAGNRGQARLARDGTARIDIRGRDGSALVRRFRIA